MALVGAGLNPADLSVPRELRLALTINGGVSLAVYIGGVAHEFNRLTQRSSDYFRLVHLLDQHDGLASKENQAEPPAVDILTGTSAGSINAAALAIAQANDHDTDLALLKALWIEHGQIGSLLRPPFRSGPASLMQGDEYFLPKITAALKRLAQGYERKNPHHPVHLTITTTLLTPVSERTRDDLGTKMVQPQHAGLFHFRSPGPRPTDESSTTDCGDNAAGSDDFETEEFKTTTVEAIGLAARASSGFPVAFEPTFLPVHDKPQLDRPDMTPFVDWADDKPDGQVLSRFAVDGGVLANTPTKPALAAIRRHQVSNRLRRRVLVLIHPHALLADEVAERFDEPDERPSLLATLAGVMGASSSVGSRSYVEEIERHNELALRWRDGRIIALSNFPEATDLTEFLRANDDKAWTLFRSMRERRGAYVLAHQVRRTTSVPFSQLIDEARVVIKKYSKSATGAGRGLPFVPNDPPASDNMPTNEWRWGLDLATGVATHATDLLRELLNTDLANLQLIPSVKAQDGTVASAEKLLKDANEAWKTAVNAGICIDVLGKAEEKVATEIGEPADEKTVDEYAEMQTRISEILEKYAARMGPTVGPGKPSVGAQAEEVLRKEVAEPLFKVVCTINKLVSRGDREPTGRDDENTAPALLGANPLRDAHSAEELLRILLTIEVIAYLLSEHGGTEDDVPSTPIEFVQLSAQVDQHFAPNFTSDDKLAGLSLNRFGAFLKRSWRANDWIWGRLDAIKIILHILLTPDAIHRLEQTSQRTPEEIVNDICAKVFPTNVGETDQAPDGEPDSAPHEHFVTANAALADLYTAAVREVTEACANGRKKPMTSLICLVAYGFQISAAEEEIPWLAQTIHDDQADGAGGANSANFLSRYQALEEASFGKPGERGYRMLGLFANSRIGQEAIGEELPTDLMIRTAATAAATTATMIGAEGSGLGFAKPLTKVVRGVVAAPYWIVIGLTHRGQLARAFAATVLALGVSLLAIGLLAPLTGFLSALVPTLGVGALLAVFAYAALRSRSVVHGAALLGLFVPLLALAAHRIWTKEPATPTEHPGFQFTLQEGAFGVALLLVLVVGTVVVANLNSPLTSPFAQLREMKFWGWLAKRLLQTVVVLMVLLLAAPAVARLGFGEPLFWGNDSNDKLFNKLAASWPPALADWLLALCVWAPVIIVVHGVVVGTWKSLQLHPHPAMPPRMKPRTPSDPPAPSPDTHDAAQTTPKPVEPITAAEADTKDAGTSAADRRPRPLRDPAGLAIAWSAFYGALYIVLAAVIAFTHQQDPPPWAMAAATTSVLLGFGFSVVAVWVIPTLRQRRLVRRLASAFAAKRIASQPGDEETIDVFVKIGEDSRYLFKDEHTLSYGGGRVAQKAAKRATELLDSGRRQG